MNDFYILLAQFFSTCLLQYFYICLRKIKQIKNSNAYENIDLAYIIHSGFISGYQNRYGDNLKPPTNVYHRMTA